MKEATNKITGRCMCGAVCYQCDGEPMTVAYCHCDDCRRHTGAPAVVWIVFDAEQVQYTIGEPEVYESSPGVGRAFCGACGTPLTWQAESKRFKGKRIVEFYVGTLDDPSRFVPDRHWFESERLAWFDTTDNFPRYSRLDGDGIQPTQIGPKNNNP